MQYNADVTRTASGTVTGAGLNRLVSRKATRDRFWTRFEVPGYWGSMSLFLFGLWITFTYEFMWSDELTLRRWCLMGLVIIWSTSRGLLCKLASHVNAGPARSSAECHRRSACRMSIRFSESQMPLYTSQICYLTYVQSFDPRCYDTETSLYGTFH